MDTASLPPKPDLWTGEPRPPRAPLDWEGVKPGRRQKAGISKVMQPPPGEGRILEWFYPDRMGRLMAGITLTLIGVVFCVIREAGFGWIVYWWIWLILSPWPFVFLLTGRTGRMSAGADWLGIGKGIFIKTYDLTAVKVFVDGAAHVIDMTDKHGGSVRVKTFALQQNQELWDLVYNGILHSVHVGGAQTNKRARDYLLLDFPPHLRNRQGGQGCR
ncbi:hypothetical protein BA062_01265 [Prauserella flavalba]|uniref:Uncharacterized protein n=2 Tax=Prauserella flavalba TaxID=1477506 RepID=A0A318LUL7_9PSEU|nr:hypothetical protein BA062_01265 [Prauserella flavalba]